MFKTSAKFLDDFRSAAGFLTVLPVAPKSWQPDALARSMAFFPLIGALIALAAVAVFRFELLALSHAVSVLALVIVPVLLTGGLHLDGFADFCDGFGGGHEREDVLRIMKDPAIGSFGAAGMTLLLLTKFVLLSNLFRPENVFIFALAASRWMQVLLSFYLPYAGQGGLGAAVAGKLMKREIFSATFFLLLFLPLAGGRGVFMLAGLLAFGFLFGRYSQHRIGGVTGDVLGAAGELTEVLVLFIASIKA